MKEYLKMADVFPNGVCVTGYDDRHSGWFSVDHDGGMSIDESRDGGYEEVTALHISHAINSHDELVAEVERLRRQLAYGFMAGWEEGVNEMEHNEAERLSIEIAAQFARN